VEVILVVRKKILNSIQQFAAHDAAKQVQVECLLMGWELYEYTLDVGSCRLDKSEWSCLLSIGKARSVITKKLTVSPVVEVKWRLSHEALAAFRKNGSIIYVTNMSLRRSYIEDLMHQLTLEGFPNWALDLRFVENSLPMVRSELLLRAGSSSGRKR
jgi:hypothetical protein